MKSKVRFGAEQYVGVRSRVKRTILEALGEPHFGLRMRALYVSRFLDQVDSGGRVLDVGCSHGQMSFWLSQTYPMAQVTGIDLNPKLIQHCNVIHKETGLDNLEFRVADILSLSDSTGFDLIVCCDVLEHISDWELGLTQMSALLRPGGKLVLHTPHKGFFQSPKFGLRRWLPLSTTTPSEEHVHEGFESDDFAILEAMKIRYELSFTFGLVAMWLHTAYEASRTKRYIWRCILTPFLYMFGSIDAQFTKSSGGGILLCAKREC